MPFDLYQLTDVSKKYHPEKQEHILLLEFFFSVLKKWKEKK